MGNANAEKNQLEVPMEDDAVMESDDERPESFDNEARKKEMRKGIDLATTLERIEKNFVITDPRLPDNPIVSITFQQQKMEGTLKIYKILLNEWLLSAMFQIFASDSFLELTEYSREEILGRNCRFDSNLGMCVIQNISFLKSEEFHE